MSAIPEEVIERVRDAADLVTVIGEFVPLRRTGADYRGACPFHGGTHRNFAVIPKKGMYYCFVCHEGGDVFTFYMKKFGMEYPTAVREVARKMGIEIPDRPTGGPDRREPLFSAVGVAAEWYASRLREADDAADARSYLKTRGFDPEALQPLSLGFAPRGDGFLNGMHALGIKDEVLFEAGLLVKREDGSLRPRFWGRLLFPIHDLRGRIVGFGGRVIGEGEPKYLNSPDSEVFHKGQLLYNLHDAKHAVRKADRAIVVEGYFDVLRLVGAGVENVVAPLGTGFTAEQAQLLKRYTANVTLLYDSDTAGLRATFRSGDALLSAPLRVTVATLPLGEDPDTLVAKGGAAAIQSVLDDAIDILERKIQLLDRKGWLGSLSGRRKALDRLLPTLRAAADPVTRDLYVSRVSEVLGVSRQSVLREIELGGGAAVPRRPDGTASRSAPVKEPPGPRRPVPERNLLRVMVHRPEWRGRVIEQIADPSQLGEPERRLMALLGATPESTPASDVLGSVDGEARMLLADLLEEPWGAVDVDAIVTSAVNQLDSRRLEAEYRDLSRRLPLAADDEKPILASRVQELGRQIAKLNPGRWNVIRKGGRVGF
ncbi:MAG: DNA primase [Gemmatimonadetes bacterium]|nr:DNA primase [Gemmatimonadota bacterium]